ncbi:hypothetical protein MXF21_01535 [Enterococcus casseliflavus]|uniref:alpha-L-arabinofuranosidase C-terminal domain-containing protein n=1 Tax=Enterococcus casseliflavus TaxID=37734 RepID=UPI002DB6F88A|nr:alpha-L-arabinofuranosidase C-terminal domain-containing protein [Enterococcus casseliflavus]MEB6084791.1 hypothetical protein [Enterococcus casseliflavus]
MIQDGIKQIPQEEGAFATDINVDLIVGEWGNWHNIDFNAPSILWQQSTKRDAITTALTLDIFHRNADKVKMACIAQSVNVLNSLFLTKGEETVLTPNYYVFKLYQNHQNGNVVALSDDAPTFTRSDEPTLKKIYSFASIKENLLTLNIINTSDNEEEAVTIFFDLPVEFVTGEELTGETMCAFNEFGKPETVTTKKIQDVYCQDDQISVTSKAASISVYQFKVKERKV